MGAIVTEQIIILTLLMGTGIALRKGGILSDTLVSGLTSLLLNLTMPALILASFALPFSPAMLAHAGAVLLYSTLIHIGLIALSWAAYWRFAGKRRATLQFATIFSNCGFVGYPVAQGVFGSVGVFYTSIFTIPFNLILWSYGLMLFTGERNWKSLIRSTLNPPTLCIFAGFFLFLFSVPYPAALLKTLQITGGMTTPISMFIIGALLADVSLREVLGGLDVYFMSLIKLVAAPLLCFGALKLIGADPTLAYVCVLLVAMPTASMIGIFAERYDGDKATASRAAFLTTVLSVVTIPLILNNI